MGRTTAGITASRPPARRQWVGGHGGHRRLWQHVWLSWRWHCDCEQIKSFLHGWKPLVSNGVRGR
uniref:Uncharacterized protein n=1 Tax=Arundo donax TaxID=35708 RepID=A0A0A9AUT5_ARUDO